MKSILLHQFKEKFHAPAALLARAPGRVNIIGEHTDYNDGYVLPMAIDRSVQIALRPRTDRTILLHALDFGESVEFSIDSMEKGRGWAEYIKGAAWAMESEGWHLNGWEGVMSGNVPLGAGLSSSSAVTMAAILACAAAANQTIDPERLDPVKLALLGHQAEDGWVGVHGGIMDQMVSMLSRPGHVLFLDCLTLAYRHIPLPPDLAVAVLDTSTRRGLVDSAYNERREQCDTAARLLGVRSLRDMDFKGFQARAHLLDEVTFRRARHVISENERVLKAIDALQEGDAQTLGHLLDASHASLRDDFEVSNAALDAIVLIARHQAGCFGARMTGAGFGGCAVALIEKECGKRFARAVANEFLERTGLKPAVYLCQPAAGAGFIRLTI